MNNFSISILDLMLIVATAFFGFRSLVKGFAKAMFSLIGVLASHLVASLYYPAIIQHITPILGSPPWINLASFTILFIATMLVFTILELTILKAFVLKGERRDLSALLAFILGLLEGFLLCSIVLWLLNNKIMPSSKDFMKESIFTPYYLNYNPLLFGLTERLRGGLF